LAQHLLLDSLIIVLFILLQGLLSKDNVRNGGFRFLNYPKKTISIEDQALIDQKLYLSGIPEINSLIRTETIRQLKSNQRFWTPEQLLFQHHELENENEPLQASRDHAAMASPSLPLGVLEFHLKIKSRETNIIHLSINNFIMCKYNKNQQ